MGEVKEYIHLFETENEYNTKRNFDYLEPWVSYTEDNTKVNYNMTEEERKFSTPLTFEITGDGNIAWKANNTAYTVTLEYSKNGGEWTSITSTTGGTDIPVFSGDTIQFRGNNTTMSSGLSGYNCFSGSTAQFKTKGNIMSLINSTDFSTLTTLESTYTFKHLFYNCTGLTDASELLLPATTLATDCYSNMFRGCTSLTTAPELPATTLAYYCYDAMFRGCTNLITAPELPATTLAESCYSNMFRGCTSLTTAPELPATTLAYGCYYWMFDNCRSLTTAPELPATTLATDCYEGMFAGCTSLTSAPELPATTLANNCYQTMFDGCGSLNYIKCLATNISATDCTNGWVNGVAATGTFVAANDSVAWSRDDNGIPVNWNRINEKSQPLTFEITNDGIIYWGTLDTGFTRTIEYSKDNGSTWTSITSTRGETLIQVVSGDTLQFRGNNTNYATKLSGGKKISFNGFMSSTAGFKVKGNIMSLINSTNFGTLTTLENANTFSRLFAACTGLTDASELILPATTLTEGCYYMMFEGCSNLTTAPELPATILANYCYSSMFSSCESLTQAPQLPATTLANSCYSGMFEGCTGLTTAPELPATTLATDCYEGMFAGCTNLNYIKCLATNVSGYSYTYEWVIGVAASGTFVKNPSMASWTTGTSGIPTGWTTQDDNNTPVLG